MGLSISRFLRMLPFIRNVSDKNIHTYKRTGLHQKGENRSLFVLLWFTLICGDLR